MSRQNLLIFATAAVLASCARAPIKNRDLAVRPTDAPKQIEDDQGYKNLQVAVERSIDGLAAKIKGGNLTMRFGARDVVTQDYVNALVALDKVLKDNAIKTAHFKKQRRTIAQETAPKTTDPINDYLKDNFEFVEVYGEQKWGDVFITGYYEPVLNGSHVKTKTHTSPILGLPKDMVVVDVPAFTRAVPDYKGPDAENVPQKISEHQLRGRLVPSTDKSVPPMIEPYDPRETIEATELKNKADVIAWVDPIDAFFLQIQGSGTIKFASDKTEARVSYVAQNGYPYVAIAQFVFDKIPRNQMTKKRLEAYLRSLPAADAKKIMNQNPSYVFFEKTTGARTLLGVEATGGRTIATDARYFAKGALAYLEFQTPVFASADADDPDHFQTTHRLVVDQDTGGAIRGPGRVDLFVGSGKDADRESGGMRQHGKLYYLVPKVKKPS